MSLQRKASIKKYVPIILPACLIVGLSFLATGEVCSQTVSDGSAAPVTGFTPGRVRSIVGGVLALISLVLAWRARANAGGSSKKRTQAIIALSLGVIAIILSIMHLSVSAGAVFGSGSGKAGAIVSLVLGVIGTVLSGLALRKQIS